MKKFPPNTPMRGERARKRGPDDGRRGTVSRVDDETRWCTVRWDDGRGPRMCHLHELERTAEENDDG